MIIYIWPVEDYSYDSVVTSDLSYKEKVKEIQYTFKRYVTNSSSSEEYKGY